MLLPKEISTTRSVLRVFPLGAYPSKCELWEDKSDERESKKGRKKLRPTIFLISLRKSPVQFVPDSTGGHSLARLRLGFDLVLLWFYAWFQRKNGSAILVSKQTCFILKRKKWELETNDRHLMRLFLAEIYQIRILSKNKEREVLDVY